MSRFYLFLVALLGLMVVSTGPVRAQEVERPVFEVELEDEHGHPLPPEKFDLNKEKQFDRLIGLLKDPHRRVVRLVQEKPFNLLKLAPELGIWTLIIFGLLYFILKKAAWGPLLEGLRKREETIQGALTDAQKARDEAKGVRDEVKRRLDQIGEEIRNLMDDARRKAEALAADMTAKARQEIQADRDRLLREIGLEKDKALKELLDQTAQLATLVSAKTIRRQLSPEDHRRLVDEALVELRQAGGANGAAKQLV